MRSRDLQGGQAALTAPSEASGKPKAVHSGGAPRRYGCRRNLDLRSHRRCCTAHLRRLAKHILCFRGTLGLTLRAQARPSGRLSEGGPLHATHLRTVRSPITSASTPRTRSELPTIEITSSSPRHRGEVRPSPQDQWPPKPDLGSSQRHRSSIVLTHALGACIGSPAYVVRTNWYS